MGVNKVYYGNGEKSELDSSFDCLPVVYLSFSIGVFLTKRSICISKVPVILTSITRLFLTTA